MTLHRRQKIHRSPTVRRRGPNLFSVAPATAVPRGEISLRIQGSMQESGSSFAKWAFIVLGIFGLVYFGYPLVFGKGTG